MLKEMHKAVTMDLTFFVAKQLVSLDFFIFYFFNIILY